MGPPRQSSKAAPRGGPQERVISFQEPSQESAALRGKILALVEEYHALAHAPKPFDVTRSPAPVSGRVYAAADMRNLVDSALDFWLTTGRFNDAFEDRLAERLGAQFAMTVNSGSSANLVALSALTSPKLRDRQLKPGDEVITAATGFPTTVNPLLTQGLVPVFVDMLPTTYNFDPEKVAAAIGPKTRAIMAAHTLGNPFDLAAIRKLCNDHDLWLIEDCCDALGSTYDGKQVGLFGDIATLSFYPAHHITTGEGGAVFTNDAFLRRLAESFRDWGRDCFCAPGQDNTCNNRFGWRLGDLPAGYDHKYTYSHIGYNLKVSDMQAALGVSQLTKLDRFIAARRANFAGLERRIRAAGLDQFLHLPHATPGSDPSWFGYLLTVRDDAGIARNDLTRALEAARVGTRLLFAGNIIRQPGFRDINHRVHGSLAVTDKLMNDAFWIGVWPGLDDARLDYMVETLDRVVRALVAGRDPGIARAA